MGGEWGGCQDGAWGRLGGLEGALGGGASGGWARVSRSGLPGSAQPGGLPRRSQSAERRAQAPERLVH